MTNKLYMNRRNGVIINYDAYLSLMYLLKVLLRLKVIKTKHVLDVVMEYQPIDFD